MRSYRIAAPTLLLALAASAGPRSAEAGRGARVVVNRVALAPGEVQRLQAHLPGPVRPGRYWYDRVSGAWGRVGAPMQGALPPNLPVRGALWRSASDGHTGVVVNGRELPRVEVRRLVSLGIPVKRGRWWLNHRGVGGPEGGPAQFDLSHLARKRGSGGRRGSVFSTWDLTGVRAY